MLPRRLRAVPLLAVATLAGFLAMPARGQDSELDKKVQDLNAITGNAVIVGEYKTLLDDPKGTKTLLKHARDLLAKDKESLHYNAAFVLAETARKLNELDSAQEFFRVCTRSAAKLESTEKLVQSYGGLIDLLYESGKYAESARVCRELLGLETGTGKPRVVLIPIETRFGTQTFVEDPNYDSVKRIKPGVHRLLIQSVTKEGSFDKAIKLVDNLVKSSKNNWEDLQLKGWVLREAGKFKEAAAAYHEVLDQLAQEKDLDPELLEKYEDRIRYALSNVYVDLNQLDKMAEQLKALISRHPNEATYYNDLGYIWADKGLNLAEAEKLIRKAIDLDRARRKKDPNLTAEENRDNGAYLDSLGWVLFKQKKYKEARDWLQKAVEDKASQHIEIYDHLGDVLLMLGQRDAAVKAWREGLQHATPSRRDQQRKVEVEKKIQQNSK
jgi:tetratricopeptide (TPR) repeat protein